MRLEGTGLSRQPLVLCRFKQVALAGLAMGTENKVAMLFKESDRFWPAETHFLRPLDG